MSPIKFWTRFKAGLFADHERKTVFENVLSLFSLQGANYLLPLLTFPYLIRVLGPAKYGLVSFAMALVQYFVIFTDYGFNLSASRAIAANRGRPDKIASIFWAVIAVKTALLLAGLAVFSLAVLSVPKFRGEAPLYFFAFGTVAGYVYFPVWFFQGMEKMKSMTLVNVLGKAIFTVLIFVFIREREHYVFVPLVYSAGHLSTALFSMGVAVFGFRIAPRAPSRTEIIAQLQEGWHIFVSRISTTLYTNSNTFLLGLFTNYETVGFYAAGEKLVRILTSLFEPVFQAFYPFIVKTMSESREKALSLVRTLFRRTLSAALVLWVLVLALSAPLVSLVLGSSFEDSLPILRLLSPLVVIIPAAFVFANLTMLPCKLDRYFSRIYLFGGLVNVVFLLCFLVLLRLGAAGAALANLLTETVLTVLMAIILRKNGIRFFRSG